jgi:hypothetical protein
LASDLQFIQFSLSIPQNVYEELQRKKERTEEKTFAISPQNARVSIANVKKVLKEDTKCNHNEVNIKHAVTIESHSQASFAYKHLRHNKFMSFLLRLIVFKTFSLSTMLGLFCENTLMSKHDGILFTFLIVLSMHIIFIYFCSLSLK